MKVIIPMAGMGKRMRPHTLTIPKPLIPIAGKPIVQRLVESISKLIPEKIEEIAFVIGDFGKETEGKLLNIAEELGAKGHIFYQKEALGTAHAIYCAAKCLEGKSIVAFADTLFRADFNLDKNSDGIIWVQKVDDPSAFGVVKTDENDVITDFIEKPKDKVSDLAIIGIYYFKEGERLREAIKYLLDNKIVVNGEYQVTDALENLKKDGIIMKPGQVVEWLDCGNKDATVYTNQRILEHENKEYLDKNDVETINSVIVEPCYIANGSRIENSVVGPWVSIGQNSKIHDSIVKNSIIQDNSLISKGIIENSMLGNSVQFEGNATDINIGDYTNIKINKTK